MMVESDASESLLNPAAHPVNFFLNESAEHNNYTAYQAQLENQSALHEAKVHVALDSIAMLSLLASIMIGMGEDTCSHSVRTIMESYVAFLAFNVVANSTSALLIKCHIQF